MRAEGLLGFVWPAQAKCGPCRLERDRELADGRCQLPFSKALVRGLNGCANFLVLHQLRSGEFRKLAAEEVKNERAYKIRGPNPSTVQILRRRDGPMVLNSVAVVMQLTSVLKCSPFGLVVGLPHSVFGM
jgi:hypothetical protein